MITAMNTNATHTESAPEPKETHRACFACGDGNAGGLRLHFEVDEGGIASAIWQPRDVFQSYPDRLHGGVIATLLDSAMVHALFAQGISGVTAELNIRYLQSVRLDQPLLVTGYVGSKKLGTYPCCANVQQNAAYVARATAKFMAMPLT
jgi:acyl-coenzyme A thioesterase PaaI-like protein